MLPNFKRSESEPPKVTPNLPPNAPQPPGLGTRTLGLARSPERSAASVIGPDLTINGNLVSKGEVQVDGEVQGDIHGTYVVIGEKARITGGIPPEKQLQLALFLASDRSNHISGKLIHVSDDWKRLEHDNMKPELYTLRRVQKI